MIRMFILVAVVALLTVSYALVLPAKAMRLSSLQRSTISSLGSTSTTFTLQASSSSTALNAAAAASGEWRQQLKVLRTGKRDRAIKYMNKATNLFPLWVVGASVLGWYQPTLFSWFRPFITNALAVTMLGMGMTLTVEDFKRVGKSPKSVGIGFLAQFSIMPMTAYLIAKALNLPNEIATGLILVGCAPGGTASNLVAMIANADVALSVLMTICSTIAAIFLTPYLASQLAGSYVKIKSSDLVLSTLQVVLAPVLLGLIMNKKAPALCERGSKVTPFLSVSLISLICGCISATNSGMVLPISPVKMISAAAGLHGSGFFFGYVFAKLFGTSERKARTISIETGMQNCALAVVLAQHLPNPGLVALLPAMSASVHSAMGSILAAFWRSNPPKGAGSWTGGLKDDDGLPYVTPVMPIIPADSAKKGLPDQLRGSDEGLQ